MSKRRNRHQSLSSILNQSGLQNSSLKKPIFGTNTMSKSIYIPDYEYNHKKSIDLTDYKQEKVLNKNTFNQNDTSQLPFMSSLRKKQTCSTYQYNKQTQMRPFSVSLKRTMNQQFNKKIFDVNAKQSRVSTAYYRWHNRSGVNTNNSTHFQCSLRDYNQSNNKNPQENNFNNFIKPIKHNDIEHKIYDQQEIICPKQKRSFRLKGSTLINQIVK